MALLAGSEARGDGTATSDLNLVIVTRLPDSPYRESIVSDGWPIEAFVHSPESIRRYFAQDVERRRPSMPRMCAEGVVVYGDVAEGEHLRREAEALLDAGPPPMDAAEMVRRRYRLTDALDDLIGSTVPAETAFIAAEVGIAAAELMLICRGRWLGHGKWLEREVAAVDPDLAAAFARALRGAQSDGSTAELVELAEAALTLGGGRLFEGYRQTG